MRDRDDGDSGLAAWRPPIITCVFRDMGDALIQESVARVTLTHYRRSRRSRSTTLANTPRRAPTTPFNIDPHDPLDMDTSTLFLTERTPRPDTANFHTSSLSRELPQPEPDWYTRLLSPLTHVYSKVPSPESTHIMSLSSKQLGDQYPISNPQEPTTPRTGHDSHGFSTVLLVFIPIIVVILTVLLGLVIFLVAVLYMRRRKGIQYVQEMIVEQETDVQAY